MRPSLSKRAWEGIQRTLSRVLDGDDHVGGHAGAELGTGLIERDAGLEVAIPGRAGGAADGLDVAGEDLAGEGDDSDGDLLADGEVAAIEFADVGADFPILEVGNLRDGHAGADGVADLEGRQAACPIRSVAVGVRLDVDVAGGLGLERHAVDHALLRSCRR